MSLSNNFDHQIYLSFLLVLFILKDSNHTFFLAEFFLIIKENSTRAGLQWLSGLRHNYLVELFLQVTVVVQTLSLPKFVTYHHSENFIAD